MSGKNERGVALLEVLVALTLIGTTGLAAIGMLNAAVNDMRMISARETAQTAAQSLMVRYAVMSRRELNQRIGQEEIGTMFVRVTRPEAELYRVAVGQLASRTDEMLVTVIHRPRDPS